MTPGPTSCASFPNESETSRETDIALTLPVTVTRREGVEIALDGVVEIGKPVKVTFRPSRERHRHDHRRGSLDGSGRVQSAMSIPRARPTAR